MAIYLDSGGIYDTLYGTNSHYPIACPIMQSPSGSATTPFSGWSMAFMSVTSEFTVTTGTAYASRSSDEQAILTAMERQVQHFVPSFNVYRCSIPSGREGSHAGAYHTVRTNPGNITTTGAFLKHISGNMPVDMWAHGYDTSAGGWQLCGKHYSGGSSGYTHNHPYGASGDSACVFLAALPMTVWGRVDLSRAQNWWPYPKNASNFGTG